MKKQALLIGINQYQFLPELKYARQDADAVANSLQQNYCFSENEVTVLTDDKPGLYKPTDKYVIQDHLEKLSNQDLDLFIFGFWGHGLFRNGQRYLCPFNVRSVRTEQQGLPFDELQGLLANIHAKNTCLILDCCQTIHDRGEAETLTVSDQTNMENAARDIVLRRKKQIPDFQSNVAILNSCKEGQSAYEWDKRQHGLFTAHLLDAMNKRSNSVMQIASYISSQIEKTASELGKEQTPFYKLEGDIQLPVVTKSTPLVTGDVFISYRHCNADLVAPVEAELENRGITYFIDRVGINYGMEYSEALTMAIEKCKLLLLFWTPEVKGSDDIVNEVVLAQKLKKTVVPYKIGNFSEVEHRKLCYHIARLSGCSVSQQTAETIRDIVDKVEMELTGKVTSPPVSVTAPVEPQSRPETIKPVETNNPLAKILAKEKLKRQKTLEQLQNEAAEAFDKEDYALAVSKFEAILKLEPNSVEAKELLSLGQSRLESQKAEEERQRRIAEEKRKAEEAARKAEEQRKAEEAKKHDISVPGTDAGERKTFIVKGVDFAFRWCPACPDTVTKGTLRQKNLQTKGFWMMETQVTQDQWAAVMGYNPSHFKGGNRPVEQVSWRECQVFCDKCKWLGLPVQLPTEAQWEYACLAGSPGEYAGILNEMAWYNSNSGRKTHPVQMKTPNAWGVYDMHGNVWEWCQDEQKQYGSQPYRGGSWGSAAKDCRSSSRRSRDSEDRDFTLGFRCVKNL